MLGIGRVRVGDLVRYEDEYLKGSKKLIGLVVGLSSDFGRAKVFWQKDITHRWVEFKFLRVVSR